MIIGIVMKDKLACKMFVDFYRHIYLNRGKPLTIAPSFYNSKDIVDGQIADAVNRAKGEDMFIIMEVPKTLGPDSTPEALLESCDLVIGLNRDMIPDAIKVVSEAQLSILSRFEENIRKFADDKKLS